MYVCVCVCLYVLVLVVDVFCEIFKILFFFCFLFLFCLSQQLSTHIVSDEGWFLSISIIVSYFDYCFLFWFLLLLMTTQQKIYSAANLSTPILSLFDSRYLSQRLTINWNNPTTAFLGGLTTIFRLRIDFCRFYFWGVVCCFLFHGGVFFFFFFVLLFFNRMTRRSHLRRRNTLKPLGW